LLLAGSSLAFLVSNVPAANAADVRAVATADSGGAPALLLSIATPPGTAEGDLLLAQIIVGGGTGTVINAPLGWDLLRRDNEDIHIAQAIYYRTASAADALDMPLHEWVFSSNKPAAGAILAVQGVDPSDVVDAHAGQANGRGGSVVAPGVTTSTSNTLLIGFFATDRSTTFTPPTTMAEQFETGGGVGIAVTGSAANETVAAAGATGDRTATTAADGFNVGALLALKAPTVAFVSAAAAVGEADGMVMIQVSLNATVTQDVSLDFAVTGGTATHGVDFTLTPGTLTIDAGNVSANVSITILDDQIDDGDESIEITISDPEGGRLGALTTFTLTIADDDTAGFTVEEDGAGTVVAESGATGAFNVTLESEPVAIVTLSVSSDDPGQAVVDNDALTFGPANWSAPQTITVTAVDDDVADGDRVVKIAVSVLGGASSDEYDLVPDASVSVTVLDDDVAALLVTESDGATSVHESGTTDAFDVVLATEPLGEVVLSITSADPGEAVVDTTTLTFGPGNWSEVQTVTVTGIDDDAADGDQDVAIAIGVLDAPSGDKYELVADAIVVVTILDDDVPGFTILETGADTSVGEDGSQDTFNMTLHSEPVGLVVLNISSDDDTEVAVLNNTLTFGPGNWSVPQTVTVVGVDDADRDGDQVVNVTVAVDVVASDLGYAAVAAQAAAVTNADDESGGGSGGGGGGGGGTGGIPRLLLPGGQPTTFETEEGTTEPVTLEVRLDSRPVHDVVLEPQADDPRLVFVPARLVFTPHDWDQVQTLTVYVLDDFAVSGAATSVTIRLVDSGAHHVDPIQLTLHVLDDDGDGTADYSGVVGGQSPMAGYPIYVPRDVTGAAGGLWMLDRASDTAHSMRLTLTNLDDLPEGVPPPPSEIPLAWTWNVEYDDAAGDDGPVRLVFRVPVDWLEANCPPTSCEPRIYHFHDGAWHALDPVLLGTDEDDLLFEIQVDDFSIFAFGGRMAGADTVTDDGEPQTPGLALLGWPLLGLGVAALAALIVVAAIFALPRLAVAGRSSKPRGRVVTAPVPPAPSARRVRTPRHAQDVGAASGGHVQRLRSPVQNLKENGGLGRHR
jgi:PGF-pre-PGF domain-containing protein